MLPVLLAFAALAIDRGILQVRDQEAQDAADAVAHAAAVRLNGSEQGLADARTSASVVASRNEIGLVPVTLDGTSGAVANLELGRWSGTEFFADTTDPQEIAAARARVVRTDIPTVFAYPAFGIQHMAVDGQAVAVAGGVSRMACPLPIAVPDCSLPDMPGLCGADLTFNPDANNGAGWALLGGSRPSASTVRSAINACGLGTVDTSDVVTMNNGTINSGLQTLAKAVSDSSLTWDEEEFGTLPPQSARSGVTRYGHVIDSWIIVFDDTSECTNTTYNGTNLDVTGFVRAVVYDVDTSGAVANRRIRARLGCAIDPGTAGGGGFYGTTTPPRFVAEPYE